MNKDVENAVDELEQFLSADLPSKIFPHDEVLKKKTGEDWYREDAFESREDVEEYITAHFKILRDNMEATD